MYDIETDPDMKIGDAGEILDAHHIALFTINPGDDPEEAWRELHTEHGDRIAVGQQRGNLLIVSWHYDHKPVAWRIRQAFRAVGMRATWEGDIYSAVRVDLTTVHNH